MTGPSEQAKHALAEAITKDVMSHTGVSRGSGLGVDRGNAVAHATAKVYDPDLAAKPGTPYTPPGDKRL